MSDLRELYQEVILDHYKKPRNFGEPPSCDRQAEGHNPLCGDKITVFVSLDGDRIREVRFRGDGCAISTASASMMTETLKGKTLAQAEELFHLFHGLVTGKDLDEAQTNGLGKLAVFGGVREFPVRVKCASLSWHTVRAALQEIQEPVSTE